MRADRLVSILLLLQNRGRLTARQLAKALEVSERTVLRDMDALGAAGVPLVATRGANGGWSLVGGYRTDLTGLKEAEVEALFVGAPAKLLADLRLERAGDAALLKVLSALPSMSRKRAEYARQRIHIDLAGWTGSREPVPLLPMLQDAVFHERKLRIEYTGGVTREVDPLGLVAKGSTWYFVGAVAGQPRTYRVSRIADVAPLDAPAERPAGFDLAAFWRESMQSFRERLPRINVLALLRRDAQQRVLAFLRYGAVDAIEDFDEERVRVAMHFDTIEAAAASLTHDAVEVLEPAGLREEILRIARRIVECAR